MVSRAKRSLIKILRAFIAQGQEETRQRGQLKGGTYSKTRCLAKAQQYLALVRKHNEARPWKRGALDEIVADARSVAGSLRIDCELRLRNIEHLLQVEGLLPATDDPTSQLIASLLAIAPEAKPTAAPAPSVSTVTVDFDEIARRAMEGKLNG